VRLDSPAHYPARSRLAPDQQYLKDLFRRKLGEMAVDLDNADTVLNRLPEQFTLVELERAIAQFRESARAHPQFTETMESMLWLAASNYRLKLKEDADISQIVIFPQSDNESRGIEDLRLVRFTDDDGAVSCVGTYTAFNGVRTLPMLLETRDFRTIAIHTLNGACAINKGLALFPRRLNGHFAMCSRIDGQNLYIMYSDMIHFWETAKLFARPKYPWELRLIGNCGSPIETREGWLLMTHGVGPMRRYCIGAMLLDLEDPTKIIGRLKEPLITPSEEEREGYVPNVVYSCGSMVHRARLFIPFAMSDEVTSMASVPLGDLLDQLIADGP
jgi:predicted GH43/DUF377 family glycosyl hydrolase